MAIRMAVKLDGVNFTAAETTLVETPDFAASAFRYASGVAALRIRNSVGEIIVLPFHGQQIWDARFHGRRLTMRTMFDDPAATTNYLQNYGAFFLHCGVTAMGNPGPGDTHPLHGEVPHAPYHAVQLLFGEDETGAYIALTGKTRYTLAFAQNVETQPVLKLHAGTGRMTMDVAIHNLKATPMEVMYLAHINFRPVDGATIFDTVPDDVKAFRVRTTIPPIFKPSEAFKAMIAEVAAKPWLHRDIVPGRAIDPELVMGLDFRSDADGWAHSIQMLPDGTADLVSHRPSELPRGVRWMCRTPDQDALGLFLPATADADGYTAEKAKGNLVIVPPGEAFRCSMAFGALSRDEAAAMAQHIGKVRAAA